LLNNVTPNKTDWKNADVIKNISDDMKAKAKQKVNLRILSEKENLNSSTLRYYAKLNNAQINILGAGGFPFFTDYALEIKKEFGDSSNFQQISDGLLEKKYLRTFEEFKKIDFKNGEQIILYKIRQKIAEDITIDSLKIKIQNSAAIFFQKYIKSVSTLECKIVFDDSVKAINGKIKSLKIRSGQAALDKIIFRGFQYINDKAGNNTDIPLKNIELELKDFEYCVHSLMMRDKFEILSVKEFRINSFTFSPVDLKTYIEVSSKNNISVNNIFFADSKIIIKGQNNKLNSGFEINLNIQQNQNSNLTFKIEKCTVGGIAIPTSIADYMIESYNPLIKGTEAVFEFKLGKLMMNENTISIQ
jgi:hypothetical protein